MEVMLGEHKARVIDIQGHRELTPWPKGRDGLIVWLQLDPPGDSLGSFSIDLALKDYSKEEFLEYVSRVGEIILDLKIRGMAEEQAKREQMEEAKDRVDLVAKNLREKFEI